MMTEHTAIQPGLYNSTQRCRQVKFSVDSEIASAFKKACADSNVSMASAISRFMADFSNLAAAGDSPPEYATRKQRRAAIRSIAGQLEKIKLCEESYRDRIPENLQNSVFYDNADVLVSSLDEAIDSLITV